MNRLYSEDTDVPSFSRVLWAVAMFREDIAESFWIHKGQREPWAQQSGINLTTSRELLSLLYSQRVSRAPPQELVNLIEISCSKAIDYRPSSDQICITVKEILKRVSSQATLVEG